jgi:hypothetical protein
MLKIAKERLLMPAGLSEQKLHEIFNKTLSTSIDYADMYFQSTFQR